VKKIRLLLKQHIGAPCIPIVKKGEQVQRGQLIASPPKMGANLHASFNGVITKVDTREIEITCQEEQDSFSFVPIPECKTNLESIAEAGIVGAGGAGFPTAEKLKKEIPQGVFIANAAECEPMLGHNIKQVEENALQLVRGIKYCLEITKAGKAYIAIKPKHKKAVLALIKAVLPEENIDVFRLPDMYPAGDERVIVREILGVELAPGELPSVAGACVDNVETIMRIAEAIEKRKPFIDKNVTISGRVQKPDSVFMDVPLGTSVSELIQKAGGYIEPYGEIVQGGPQTGKKCQDDTPVTKTTGAFLVAMPFPQEKRDAGILVCECGGSEERLCDIAHEMGAVVVAIKRCKRMVEKDGRYRCDLPGVCPGQAEAVLELKKQGAKVLIVGTCSH